ncbi:hypothetical protein RMN57_07930 [Kitasatospora sp. CM 4170]|uniref:Uncharacterized protein n=1 Tax=Kitasatospora aburaviensis TaxID=67265 RepID=A0ABW1EQT9_9ACTN|nr:hypothetical protein [Kitasatospora sp. CM 4170]WNM44649.1 hypothetical protein RMN57_07930 [Kitasatospora sp. CM 4170]
MSFLVCLIPLFLGIAVITDFRGISRFFMQPSNRSSANGPTRVHLLAGWVFIAISVYGLVYGGIDLARG